MGTRKIHTFQIGILAVAVLLIGFFVHTPQAEAQSAPSSISTNQRMQLETRSVLNIIRDRHLLGIDFRELDYNQLIENYLSRLDFLHMFLLQEDKEEFLERFENTMLSYLERGNLYPAFQMFERYQQRMQERMEWIQERLKGDFDFNTDQLFETNREKASWPANQEDADTLWEQRLLFELIRETLVQDEPDIEEAKKKVLQQFERMKRNLMSLEADDIQEIFLTTLMQLFDPHSTFMSANTMEDLNISMQNSLEGIGAMLREEDGVCTIHELVPPGPAYRSGALFPRDRILSVGQADAELEDIRGLPLRKIVNKIRGPAGTTVSLLVQPADTDDPQDRRIVKLVREKIQLTTRLATASLFEVPLDNQANTVTKIGVIKLPGFYGDQKTGISATNDVEELVLTLKQEGIDGLILDLRNNGGGLLNEAIDMTGLFIPQGPVVAVRENARSSGNSPLASLIRGNAPKVLYDHDPKVVYEGPMIVLVSRHSASAAEILAGALQSYNRALIVGDRSTHGKGTVQAIHPLSNFLAAAVKLTTSQFFLPNGDSTQLEGVKSDIQIPSISEILDVGESSFSNPIAWDQIPPKWGYTSYIWREPSQITPSLIEYLKERSQERITTLEEFVLLQEYLVEVEKQRDNTKLSLNFDVRKQQKEEWDLLRDNWKKRQSELADKYAFTSKEFELSVVEELERTTHEWEAKSENANKQSSSESPAKSSEEDPDNEEIENSLDISLRESLRILADWLLLQKQHATAILTLTGGN